MVQFHFIGYFRNQVLVPGLIGHLVDHIDKRIQLGVGWPGDPAVYTEGDALEFIYVPLDQQVRKRVEIMVVNGLVDRFLHQI